MATIDEMAGGDIQARDRMRREQGRSRPDIQAEPPTTDPAYRGPGMDINADKMGGKTDDGSVIEYGPDMQPRRVPGPQSMGQPGSMGDLIASSGTDADTLVKMVRQDRLARQAGGQRTPTFGEVAENNRAMQAEQAAQAGPSPEEQQAQTQAIAKSIRFLVDTKTGHFEPVLPEQEAPQPGPHDILMSVGDDPTQPNIIAQGKRVTPASLARLGDPKRGIQPALRPGYKLPEQYAGLGKALGLEAEDQGPDTQGDA